MSQHELDELDAQILRVQQSTKTLSPAFIRAHNWLRMKSPAYYGWHMNPFHTAVHIFVLLAYVLNIGALTYHLANKTQAVLASGPTAFDLADSNNYHLRIDGAAATDGLGLRGLAVGDFNNNGRSDLVVISPYTDFSSRSNSGSMYIILDIELSSLTGTGNTIDLSNTSKYALRFDLPQSLPFVNMTDTTSDMMQNVMASDYNGDGKDDILLPLTSADISAVNTGSLYFISNTIINQHLGSGTTLDLADSGTYTLRIDGKASGDTLGFFTNLHDQVDYDSDGKNDLIIGPGGEDNTATNSGSLYLLNSSLLAGYTGTGNVLDLNDVSKFNIRYDGEIAVHLLGSDSVITADINGNGKNDLIIGSSLGRFNGRASSGSIHIIYDDLLNSYTGTGNIVQLPNPGTYSLRIDAPVASILLSRFALTVNDLDGDGKLDIAAGGYQAANNGAQSGSAWIIPGSIMDDYSERGSTIDLLDSSKYWLRIDGSGVSKLLTYNNLASGDFNNDGKSDLLVGMHRNNENDRADSGSAYVIDSSVLRSYAGTGNSFNMSDSTKYQFRWDGAAAGDRLVTTTYNLRDVNSDGINDLWLNSYYADNNGRTDSGSLYFIFLFPHTIATPIISGETASSTRTVTGSVAATNSLSTIATVQASLNSSTPNGDWSDCTAADGAFDSKSESYSCNLALPSEGTHMIRIRAKDSYGIYTPLSLYKSVTTTYAVPVPVASPSTAADTTAPTLTLTAIGNTKLKKLPTYFTYISSNSRPTFSGSAEVGARVIVSIGDKEYCQAVAESDVWSCTGDKLDYKEHQISIIARDAAGNETKLNAFTLNVVDRLPSPAPTTATSVGSEASTGTSADEAVIEITNTDQSNGFVPVGATPYSTTVRFDGETIRLSKFKLRILDAKNNPLSESLVTLHSDPQSTVTDNHGVATFGNVPTGRHTLEYVYNGAKISRPITIALASDVASALEAGQPVEVTLEPAEVTLPVAQFGLIALSWTIILLIATSIAGYVGYKHAYQIFPQWQLASAHQHVDVSAFEKEIDKIQHSTQTTLPIFTKVHNWLRMHSRAYYWWHLLPHSRSWTVGVLILYVLLVMYIVGRAFIGK